MEQTKGYEKKLSSLEHSLTGFQQSLEINASAFGVVEKDTIRNGQVQKFEVCVELFWKTAKKFLYEVHGLEALSPKAVMKTLYRINYADEKNYEALMEMINDRNRLSHIYNEARFNEIYNRLAEYLQLMIHLTRTIKNP